PVPVPPPDRDPPLGLDPDRQPGRDDDGVEQEQDQGPAQPRTSRPRRVTAPGGLAVDPLNLPPGNRAWRQCRAGVIYRGLVRRIEADRARVAMMASYQAVTDDVGKLRD